MSDTAPVLTARLPRFSPRMALILAAVLTMIAFDRPLVRGDGLAYLVWIDTLVLDQDVNLNNQHDRFREVNTYQIEWNFERERWVNIFPFGIAFVQAPFYVGGHISNQAGLFNSNPDYFRQMQGVTAPYSLWLMFGANIMMLVAVVLAWHIGKHFTDDWTAALVVYAVFIGTPLFYYSTIAPVNSHNAGGFTMAVFIYLLYRVTARENVDPRWMIWTLLGIFAALTVMARWQLALAVAPGWVLLAWQRQWRGLLIATTAAALALLPLPLIWSEMFGSPFIVPFDTVNDEAFMQSGSNQALNVLRELIRHSPIVLLSLFGIAALYRTNRQWAILTSSIILLQLLVNGAALDWNAGESYGMRRMSEIYIIYAILACAAVGQIINFAQQRQWHFALIIIWAAIFILIGYTFLYIFAYMDFTWTHPSGAFIDRPEVMIDYFLNQPHRLQILWEVYRTHVGPLAWSMPGP